MDKMKFGEKEWSKDELVRMLKQPAKELRVTEVDQVAKPTLEIALLMDCTSSMSSWIETAKQTLNSIIDNIIKECKNEGNLSVRVAFVGYRDIKDTQVGRFEVKSFTDNIHEVRSFINQTHATGGRDWPEDLQGGLKLALLQDWTKEAFKRVFVICDAPCHGTKYHSCMVGDDYPNGSPDGLVLEDLMKEFCKKDIEFQFIKLNNDFNQMIEIMKDCHQELEVTDMSLVRTTQAPRRELVAAVRKEPVVVPRRVVPVTKKVTKKVTKISPAFSPLIMDLHKLTKIEKVELCVSFAAMMLHDDGLEVTSERLQKAVKHSGNEIEPYMPMLFAKALKGQDIDALLQPLKSEEVYEEYEEYVEHVDYVEEKKEEEEDVDMGGLFGGDDDDYGCESDGGGYFGYSEPAPAISIDSVFRDAMVKGTVNQIKKGK